MSSPIECLSVALPYEVSCLIDAGQIDAALERIDLVLARTRDPLIHQRLELEKHLLPIMVEAYPYTKDEALSLIRRELPEFTGETFDRWEEAGMIEYRLYEGKKHYFNRFWALLKKFYPEIQAMTGGPSTAELEEEQKLTNAIRTIRETGSFGSHFRIRASLGLTDSAFAAGDHVLVHLPFPKPVYPMKNIRLLSASHDFYVLAPEDAPSRTISFETDLTKNKIFSVEYEYDCEIAYHDLWNDTPATTAPDFETGEILPHVRFTPYLRSLAASIVGSETDPLKKTRLIYDFCTSELVYTYMPPYVILKDIAETCAVRRKGDCGVQSLLFITLCRISGVPARFQSALYVPATGTAGCHDWAEFYTDQYGWLPTDISYGSSAWRKGDEIRRRFYFGNLDPYRMIANTAFQADFIPPKKALRYDPYDNQTGEIEVNGCKIPRDRYQTSTIVLEQSDIR
ncbi:MAG: transglutaminase domain-containing protein [Lachnospiraceae bacterium]|nr:transglutaminase domain-containing protein [Lachnospiraceae bacterium]